MELGTEFTAEKERILCGLGRQKAISREIGERPWSIWYKLFDSALISVCLLVCLSVCLSKRELFLAFVCPCDKWRTDNDQR